MRRGGAHTLETMDVRDTMTDAPVDGEPRYPFNLNDLVPACVHGSEITR